MEPRKIPAYYTKSKNLLDPSIPPSTKAYKEDYSNLRGIINPFACLMDKMLEYGKHLNRHFQLADGADISLPHTCHSADLDHDTEDIQYIRCWADGEEICYVPTIEEFTDAYPTRWVVSGELLYAPFDSPASKFIYGYSHNYDSDSYLFTVENDYIKYYSFPNLGESGIIDSGFFVIGDKTWPQTDCDFDDTYYIISVKHPIYTGLTLMYYPFPGADYNVPVDDMDYIYTTNNIYLLKNRPSFNPEEYTYDADMNITDVNLADSGMNFQPHKTWIGDVSYSYTTHYNYSGYFGSNKSYYNYATYADSSAPDLFYSTTLGNKKVLAVSLEEIKYGIYRSTDVVHGQLVIVSGMARSINEYMYYNPSYDNPYTFTITDPQFTRTQVNWVALQYLDYYNSYIPVDIDNYNVEVSGNTVTVSGEYDNHTRFKVLAMYDATEVISPSAYIDYTNLLPYSYDIIDIWNNSYVQAYPLVNAVFSGTVGNAQLGGEESFDIRGYQYSQMDSCMLDHHDETLNFINPENGCLYTYNKNNKVFDKICIILCSGTTSKETCIVKDCYQREPLKEVWDSNNNYITGYLFNIYDERPIDCNIHGIIEDKYVWYVLTDSKVHVLDKHYDENTHYFIDSVDIDPSNNYSSMTIDEDNRLMLLANNSGILYIQPKYDYAYSDPEINKIYFRELYTEVDVSGHQQGRKFR